MNLTLKIKIVSLINLAFLFYGCGRTDNGYIVNNTDDTVSVFIKLNYPANEYCPENYLREQLLTKEKSTVHEYKLGGDCLVSFDSVTNSAVLKLYPYDQLNLGTVRVGLHRNDYRTWEFTKIVITSPKFKIEAKDKEIMNYVESPNCAFGQNAHAFLIKPR